MKQGLIIALVILFAVSTASAQKPIASKPYIVTLTPQEWQSLFQSITNLSMVAASSAKYNGAQIMQAQDSLTRYMSIIQEQLIAQQQAEQKADTAKPVTKKPK